MKASICRLLRRLFGQEALRARLANCVASCPGPRTKKETGTMRLMDYEWSKPESNKLLSNPTSHVSTGIKGIQGHMVTSSRAGKNRGWSVPVLLRMPRLLRALACLLRLRVKEFTPQGILVILIWGRLKTSCPFSLALCGIKAWKFIYKLYVLKGAATSLAAQVCAWWCTEWYWCLKI